MRKALIGFVLGAAVFAIAQAALAADVGAGAAAAVSANAAANGPSAAAESQAAGFTRWLSTGSVKLPPTQPDIAACLKCAAIDASCCSSGGGMLAPAPAPAPTADQPASALGGVFWYCC